MSIAAVGFTSPVFHHHCQEPNATTALARSRQIRQELRQTALYSQKIRVQTNEAPCCLAAQYRERSSPLQLHRNRLLGSCFAAVGAEEQIDDGVFKSQNGQDKLSTSLDENEFDEPIALPFGNEAPALESHLFTTGFANVKLPSYLKSMTRRHWQLVTRFVNQESDVERRLELEEACSNLVATIYSVRFILHNKYLIGERLDAIDEEIVEQILCYHPKKEEKFGCGLDFIKIDLHPDFERRCFFVVRKDGSSTDFSFRKCILELGQQTIGLEMTKTLLDLRYTYE